MTFSDALKMVRETDDNIFVITGCLFEDKYYFVTVSSKEAYETGDYVEAIYIINPKDGSMAFDSLINICCLLGDEKSENFIDTVNKSKRIDS
jgi:hypothetical protein